MTSEEQRRSNLRLAWALAAVVALLFVGFIVKSALFGI
jgi:formate hydrogenlyase subunit 3/multisubunit Na+/H+ antiporter MnhD subunit